MNLQDLTDQPVIIGAGLAGLMAALHLAPEPVLLVTAGSLDAGAASLWSQGGIAAAIGANDDPALHAADTMAAGDGLGDRDIVTRVTAAAPEIIDELARFGTAFNRDAMNALALGLEAAHCRRRIVHAGGDRTGFVVTTALAQAVAAAPHVTILERKRATALHVADGRIIGVSLNGVFMPTSRVLIATGGLGGLYAHTSNPLGAVGSGLALAARAGAVLRDMEFVQFHPTALDAGLDLAKLDLAGLDSVGPNPMPLISEAVRGEGATLIDQSGHRFMADVPGAELAPRDVVARAVFAQLTAGHRVFLDARIMGARFSGRFPSIDAACRKAGIDPAITPIPVRPAAHYHMGGISTKADGSTSLPGLFAAGEAACTGFHGANRLASNSLLEAAWLGRAAARSMAGYSAPPGIDFAPPPGIDFAPEPGIDFALESGVSDGDAGWVRGIAGAHLGVLRDQGGLERAIAALAPHAHRSDPALVALMLAVAALDRRESRGGHARVDFPGHAVTAQSSFITMETALARTAEITSHRRAA
jgi:L-aspartate oxidase